MKFLVPNYICLQNPWLGGLPPPDPHSLCPLSPTEFVKAPPKKIPGYATVLQYTFYKANEIHSVQNYVPAPLYPVITSQKRRLTLESRQEHRLPSEIFNHFPLPIQTTTTYFQIFPICWPYKYSTLHHIIYWQDAKRNTNWSSPFSYTHLLLITYRFPFFFKHFSLASVSLHLTTAVVGCFKYSSSYDSKCCLCILYIVLNVMNSRGRPWLATG